MLIDLYNANTEEEHINVLSHIFVLSEKFDINLRIAQLIMWGDFNLFFASKLDAQGGNPTIKRKSFAKIIEFKESHGLCYIWRVRNTKSKWFRNIFKVSFNVDLTMFSFQILFKIW